MSMRILSSLRHKIFPVNLHIESCFRNIYRLTLIFYQIWLFILWKKTLLERENLLFFKVNIKWIVIVCQKLEGNPTFKHEKAFVYKGANFQFAAA